jgi:DNA invertase Pin-like site-specific DNA recombinase
MMRRYLAFQPARMATVDARDQCPAAAARSRCKSLRENRAGTTTPVGQLMITIIGGIAKFERELVRAALLRDANAKANGKHMGRPSKLTPRQRQEAIARRLLVGERERPPLQWSMWPKTSQTWCL